MGKRIFYIITLVFFIISFLVVSSNNILNAQKPKAKGHVVYDRVDEIFRCLGSPINCNW